MPLFAPPLSGSKKRCCGCGKCDRAGWPQGQRGGRHENRNYTKLTFPWSPTSHRSRVASQQLRLTSANIAEQGKQWTRRWAYTVFVLRMAHRKWKEFKQQPSMLTVPAVPGYSLVSFHFLWATWALALYRGKQKFGSKVCEKLCASMLRLCTPRHVQLWGRRFHTKPLNLCLTLCGKWQTYQISS